MITRTKRLTLLTSVVAIATAAAALATDDLSWHTIDGGGGDSAGGDIALRGTIGQPDTGGAMSGDDWSVVGGFWSDGGVMPTECPGDATGDRLVNFDDLIAVLSAWGVCGDCPEDLDDSGFVDFDDLLLVLANWGSPC